jgi:hypothetical protein
LSYKLLLFIISWFPTLCWFLILQRLKIPSDIGVIIPNIVMMISRIILIVYGTILELLNYRNWYIFWLLLLIVVILKKVKMSFIKIVLQPSLITMLVLFFTVYLISNLDTYWYVSSSIDRILLQLTPMIYLIFVERVNILFKS